MSNNKDFVVKNAVEVGGPTKVTVGDAATGGSYTAGYELSGAAYDSVSFSVAGQDASPASIVFNSDGTKMYMIGYTSDNVHQYSLLTAYDISTASYDSVSFSVSGQEGLPFGIAFNNNGTKMYIVGFSSDAIYQYSLSTAYDVSTASYDSVSLDVSSQDGSPHDIGFNLDGTKIYMMGSGSDQVHQYSLSTAYDLSTATYDSVSLSVTSQDTTPRSFKFNADGTKLFMLGSSTNTVYQYSLSTGFDVSTGSYDSVSFSVNSQDTLPFGLAFNGDGSKMYMIGSTNDTIYQYSTGSTVTTGSFDLSTGNYFTDTPSADVEYTFSNAGDVQSFQLEVTGNSAGYDGMNATYDSKNFSTGSQDTNPFDVAFKSDGTKMYVMGQANDTVYQYSLSTAWDVSTASYDSVNLSVTSQDTGPYAITFKPDGTTMYMAGIINDTVYQYTLSTAWDLSTASYASKSYNASAQVNLTNVRFKPDGTKMYLLGTGQSVHQYSLSTAWDVSTASYDSKSLATSVYYGFDFNSSGTKMFGINFETLYEYNLSTAWDVSTGSAGSTLSIAATMTSAVGVTFSSDGTKMYAITNGNDTIYQFSSSTAITVTWDADIAWPSGTAPDSPAAGEKDIYTFTTDDGGTTYIGVQSGDAFS